MPASLTVVAGPLTGARLDIDDAIDEVLVGSDPGCRLALELPGVSPIHARLWLDPAGLTVFDTHSARGVFVNDTRVEGQASVRDRDVLWLGPPGDPDSVMIECRIEQAAVPAPGPAEGRAEGAAPEAEPEPHVRAGPDPDLPPIPLSTDTGEAVIMTDPWAEQAGLPAPVAPAPAAPPPGEPPPTPAEPALDTFFFEEPGGPAAAAPAGDLADLLGDTPPPVATAPPPPAEAAPAAADVFFEEIPAPDAAPPPPAGPGEDMFFVEAEAAPVPKPVAAPRPAATTPAPAASPPAAPKPAPAAAKPAPLAAKPAPVPPKPAAPPAAPATPPGTPASPVLIQPPHAATPAARRAGAAQAAPTAAPAAPAVAAVAAPRPAAAPASRPAVHRGGSGAPVVRYALIATGALVLLAAAGFAVLRTGGAPSIASVTPARVGLGQNVVITGARFAATPAGNVVRFGERPGRVVQAAADRLQVEIPEMALAPGRDTPVSVVVVAAGRESKAATVAVFEAPRVHGISPNVGMPGDTIVLAGAGWGAEAKVRFGTAEAAVVESSPSALKVTVPALAGPTGQEFPVVVVMGGDASNPAPFMLGRLPLVLGVQPPHGAPGDVVTVSGRGFDARPAANEVKVGGTRAIVVSASGSELKVAVPHAAPGEARVEVKVPGSDDVGQAGLTVDPLPDPIDFRFAVEPFEDAPGHEHAVVSSGLGPAFVLSASGGRSAGERAVEAARRLNDAAGALKASVDADLRIQAGGTTPTMVLVGKNAPLFEVTAEDAAGYDEDWTGLKGRGGAVTQGRLAAWWEAVARDLVRLLVRGEKPHFAADLAPEGRVFVDLGALSRKVVAVGVPRQAVVEAKPPLRDALRVAGLRVPPSVKDASAAASAGPSFKLEGEWSGSERDSGELHYVTVTFAGGAGTLTYQRALALSVSLVDLQQQGSTLRFTVQTGVGKRFYRGQWDGKKITGTLSTDAAGKAEVGTFELSSR